MKMPFTTEQFFKVIENYNASLFPTQFFILIIGIAAVFLLHHKRAIKNKLIGGFLGFIWIWIGIVYHLSFFIEINKAAYGFGVLFIVQGIFFLFETFSTKRLVFEFKGSFIGLIGYFLIWFGLIIYPALIYSAKTSVYEVISLGLPCPTTILTFGFMMLTHRSFSKYLLIIPTIWAVIGTGAAINFGIYADYVMIVSAILANIYLIARKK